MGNTHFVNRAVSKNQQKKEKQPPRFEGVDALTATITMCAEAEQRRNKRAYYIENSSIYHINRFLDGRERKEKEKRDSGLPSELATIERAREYLKNYAFVDLNAERLGKNLLLYAKGIIDIADKVEEAGEGDPDTLDQVERLRKCAKGIERFGKSLTTLE